MKHSELMRRGNPGRQLADKVDAFFPGYPSDPAKQAREILTVHELHRHIVLAFKLAYIIDAAHIRMGDLAGHPHLVLEQGKGGFISPEPARQQFQGDGLAKLEVIGPVHLAHPAAAQETDDPVAPPEMGARKESPVLACGFVINQMIRGSLWSSLPGKLHVVAVVSGHLHLRQ
jgi:hypothetical protein